MGAGVIALAVLPSDITMYIKINDIYIQAILEDDHRVINIEMRKYLKKHSVIINTLTSRTKLQLHKMYSCKNSNPFGLFALLGQTTNYAYFW